VHEAPRLHADPPAFFLDEGHDAGAAGEPRLLPEDAEHAARVRRLAPGDLLVGLDGRGGRHPLRVRAVGKRRLELERAGEPSAEAAPGSEGASLPWIELAVAWPRKKRVEGMVDRLVQLGAAAIRPLAARQRGPEEVPEEASARLRRVAREACKQSGRAWLPEFEPVLTPAELARVHAARGAAGGAVAVLDPRSLLALDSWLRSLQPALHRVGTRERPIVLVIGPEGGLADDERTALLDAGAGFVRLGPHVLRVETAAEAAMAVAAAVHTRLRSAPADRS
jgi:16S rRNA (uracil1498-N3)-methyltransferase